MDGGLSDEKIAYPMLEKAQKLGVTNICIHKGLPWDQWKTITTHVMSFRPLQISRNSTFFYIILDFWVWVD